jgi:hypothetical protein
MNFRDLYYGVLALRVLSEPTTSMGIMARNCIQLDGELNWLRVRGELWRLLQLTVVWATIPLVFLALNAALIWCVNNYVVPLPFVAKLATAFNIEEEHWEANIEREIGRMTSMAEHYENWAEQRGLSAPAAKAMEKTLWHGWPVYFGLTLFGMISFYILVLRICLKVSLYYRKGLLQRKEQYYDLDLQNIPRDRIL